MCRKRILPLVALVLLLPFTAQADQARQKRITPASTPSSGQETIDISGFMEWPKGDTRIPWGRPQAFSREADLVYGLKMKQELFRPVDRTGLMRRMEVEQRLGR